MSSNRMRTARAALLAAALAVVPGCTLFDDWPYGGLKGTPFSPEQPQKKISVVGEVKFDRSGGSDSCPAGRTVFWGTVVNDGDVDVDGVTIIIDAYNADGGLIGSFKGDVFNGNVEGSEGDVSVLAETNLAVDESGSFAVCAAVGVDSVARAEGHADGVVITDSGE